MTKKKTLLYVAKAFKDKSALEYEVSTLKKIAKLQIPFLNVVQPVHGKKVKDGKKTYWILQQTAAEGKTLDNSIGSFSFEQVRKVVQTLAHTVSKMHAPQDTSGEEGQTDLLFFTNYIVTEEDTLSKYGVDKPIKALNEVYIKLAASCPLQLKAPAYTHGDLHWGNVAYEPQTDKMTLIDLERFRFHTTNDFCFEALLDVKTTYICISCMYIHGLITKEQRTILEDDFSTIYAAAVCPSVEPKTAQLFWRITAYLSYVDFWIMTLDETPSQELKKYMLQKIKELFKDAEEVSQRVK